MQKALVFLVVSLLIGCQKKEEKKEDNNFNRSKLLAQAADNIIAPSYYYATLDAWGLQQLVDEFVKNQDEDHLAIAQFKWRNAATNWQGASMFNFGPGGEMGINKSLNEEVATFPVSSLKIENYIQSNDTTFNNFDRDTRGFFAIEYLLFGSNQTSAELIKEFAKNPFRALYLRACVNKLTKQLEQVNNAWKGDFSNQFKSNTGTDIGSSISLYYNEYLKSFENLKNFKFGIPLGLRPGQTAIAPEKVEAYYSGASIQLAKAHWGTLKLIWEGGRGSISDDGIGFKEYLFSIEGGNALIESTQLQMIAIDSAFNRLPNKPLSKAIVEDFEKVNAVHTELQKMTRFLKSDLSSLIGVAVTYSSGDGD
jgi:predicted lipoprotein